MTEAELQSAIIDAAELGGWLIFHDNDSRRNRPGFPDLVLVRGPDILFVELKTDTGRVTAEQRVWLDGLSSIDNVSCGVIRPSDADGLIRRLVSRPVKS
jgi:hypothetical protein